MKVSELNNKFKSSCGTTVNVNYKISMINKVFQAVTCSVDFNGGTIIYFSAMSSGRLCKTLFIENGKCKKTRKFAEVWIKKNDKDIEKNLILVNNEHK